MQVQSGWKPAFRHLPREKTESGVWKSSWCNGWPPRLPRLSGGSTVNLARFPWSGGTAEKVNLSRFPWSGGLVVNLSRFPWSGGPAVMVSRFLWSGGAAVNLSCFLVVWWFRGKVLKFSLESASSLSCFPKLLRKAKSDENDPRRL